MRPPIIGVTTYSRNEGGQFYLHCAYLDALRAAGGVPLLLPPGETAISAILEILDGLVLSGGGDIEPAVYAGDPHHTVYAVDPERDDFELVLARQSLDLEIPILGICRGMQILNVASGGNLVTHVPDIYGCDILHRTESPRQPVEHGVTICSNSRLGKILCHTEVDVVSWHHQAICTLATNWQGVAHAPDGVLEAMEHSSHPWAIALQWHPELSATTPWHQKLFQAFVEAATFYGQQRKLPQATQQKEGQC
jgi:putative glutamine amidotransferase